MPTIYKVIGLIFTAGVGILINKSCEAGMFNSIRSRLRYAWTFFLIIISIFLLLDSDVLGVIMKLHEK